MCVRESVRETAAAATSPAENLQSVTVRRINTARGSAALGLGHMCDERRACTMAADAGQGGKQCDREI